MLIYLIKISKDHFSNYENSIFWLNPTNLENLPYGENSTIWSLDIGNINDQDIL